MTILATALNCWRSRRALRKSTSWNSVMILRAVRVLAVHRDALRRDEALARQHRQRVHRARDEHLEAGLELELLDVAAVGARDSLRLRLMSMSSEPHAGHTSGTLSAAERRRADRVENADAVAEVHLEDRAAQRLAVLGGRQVGLVQNEDHRQLVEERLAHVALERLEARAGRVDDVPDDVHLGLAFAKNSPRGRMKLSCSPTSRPLES
jgi:hypothetical protein